VLFKKTFYYNCIFGILVDVLVLFIWNATFREQFYIRLIKGGKYKL
jgi:hypothetical protein